MIRITLRLLMCLSFALSAQAQVSSASLTGLITDPSGGSVSGAKVTVKSATTNFERSVQSDSNGYYFFASLPVGPL